MARLASLALWLGLFVPLALPVSAQREVCAGPILVDPVIHVEVLGDPIFRVDGTTQYPVELQYRLVSEHPCDLLFSTETWPFSPSLTVSPSTGLLTDEPLILTVRLSSSIVPVPTNFFQPALQIGGRLITLPAFEYVDATPDCSGDLLDDRWQLENGLLQDCNRNGGADSCEGAVSCLPPPVEVPFADDFRRVESAWRWTGTETSYGAGGPSLLEDGVSRTVVRLSDRVGRRTPLLSVDFESDAESRFLASHPTFADFHFDTIAEGIASPPRSASESNRALKLSAAGASAFQTIAPSDPSLQSMNSFMVRFDAWMPATEEDWSQQPAGGFLEAGPVRDVAASPFAGWMLRFGANPTLASYRSAPPFSLQSAILPELPEWFGVASSGNRGFDRAWATIFPSGTMQGEWVTYDVVYTQKTGRVILTPTTGPYAGRRLRAGDWDSRLHFGTTDQTFLAAPAIALNATTDTAQLLIDNVEIFDAESDDLPATNHLTLAVKAAGVGDLQLHMLAHVFGDVVGKSTASPLTESALNNAVYLSVDDGASWYEAIPMRQRTEGFTRFSVSLSDLATSRGITLTDSTLVRITQNSDLAAPEAGIEIDYLRLVDAALPPVASINQTPIFVRAVPGIGVSPVVLQLRNTGGGLLTARFRCDLPFVTPSPSIADSFGQPVAIEFRIDVSQVPMDYFSGMIEVDLEELGTTLQIPIDVDHRPVATLGFDQSGSAGGRLISWVFENPLEGILPGTAREFRDSTDRMGVRLSKELAYGSWASPLVRFVNIGDPPPSDGAVVVRHPGALTTYSTGPYFGFFTQYPTFRGRISEESFHRSDMVVVSNAQNVSSIGYFLAVGTPFTVTRPTPNEPVRLFAEFYSGAPNVVANIYNTVYTLAVSPAFPSSFPVEPTVSWDFMAGATNGFVPFDVSEHFPAPAESLPTANGLLLRGVSQAAKDSSVTPPTIFGAWQSPLIPRVTTRSHGVMIRWTVATDAPTSATRAVAPFRLRVNDEAFAISTITQIDSMDDGRDIPAAGASTQFVTYHSMPDLVIGAETPALFFSFDYLFTDERSDDPTLGIYLQKLEIWRAL